MKKSTTKKKRAPAAAKKKTTTKKIKKTALKKLIGGITAGAQPMGWIMAECPTAIQLLGAEPSLAVDFLAADFLVAALAVPVAAGHTRDVALAIKPVGRSAFLGRRPLFESTDDAHFGPSADPF